MSQNIIEHLREASVKKLFNTETFRACFPVWSLEIDRLTPAKTPRQILDLGDNLSDIFRTTSVAGRSQSEVSGGGTAWEALVCWYLNLCLIGGKTVVVKHNKDLIPSPVSDAISVNYNNFVSNTESDLIAITFPNRHDYNIDKETISILDENGLKVPTLIKRTFNLMGILNALSHRDFSDIEIHIVQCKTNWNDNAQIPMLWDMIYSASNFRTNISVGKNGYSIHNARRFTYSFVTVPTSNISKIKSTSTCVKRITGISGGNYWGRPTTNNIASSVKEMLQRNLSSGHSQSHLSTLTGELPKLSAEYSYFGIAP